MQFRHGNEVVQAFRWTGSFDQDEDPTWMNDRRVEIIGSGTQKAFMLIETPRGQMTALRGDWIVQDAKGDIYPYQPEAFAKSFERDSADPYATAAGEGTR